ncbi:V-set and transmembrane domain-containing protein 1 isoform X2 [Echinops telfairi]|uniref:V-set and transmembrane domain-containing protein 1 isoform X2 n=1 Tax=Echinops telfairi TaxID=9371 RepID=A0AC55DAL4_ECHTE|nr:V-set and transmembrane domain-containing protein 1 isoform X2 [Echinops telfairi]
MHTECLLLLCLGLCLGYEEEKKPDTDSAFFPVTLPKPLLRAWPSSVAESRSNVTLTCRSPFRNSTFCLGKLNSTELEQRLSPVGKDAELLLTDLQPEDAGQYFCAYKTADSQGWSKREHVHLVVTGSLPKPSLSYTLRLEDHRLTLQCLIPYNGTEYLAVALLKAGLQAPLQVMKIRKDHPGIMYWSVMIQQSGNYSCVYYQWDFPYLASFPSNFLKYTLRDEGGYERPETTERPETLQREIENEALDTPSSKPGSTRLIFVTVFTCISIVLLFLFIFLIYRCTQHNSAPGESTERASCAEVPDEEAPESADLGSDLEPR